MWAVGAALLFIVHATFYLYFFVDDEGISLVYAQNLLRGQGLTYSAFEGPVEGYSNFLHIFTMAGVLWLVEAAGLDRMWTFVAGGALALACGVGIVALVSTMARRLELPTAACVAAVMVVALSGPLAVWSNSSLETVPFAFAFAALMATTIPSITRPAWTIGAAAAVLLLRVDGALFAAVWLGAVVVAGDTRTRRLVLTRVAPALLVIAGTFVAWRVWYFGDWLTLPLQTKVAHKLTDAADIVVRRDTAGYLLPFFRHAGWPLLFGLVALAGALFWHDRRRGVIWTIAIAVVVLGTYVGAVGDWMFGFRFTVALLAPMALLCAFGVAMIEGRTPRVAAVIVSCVIVASGVAAWQFARRYEVSTGKTTFWRAPSLDPARRFGEYYELLRAVRPLADARSPIALHEAGFVPFLLRAENVDMLGLTSRFVGSLPSRDAVFTDVGRYYPLTAEPAHHAVHAYLLYREPRLVIVRHSWMRTANNGHLPPEILEGRYGLAAETASFAIYGRREPEAGAGIRADRFLENLAHPAYARRVSVDGRVVLPERVFEEVPSLWQGRGQHVDVDPRWTLHVDPESEAPVHEMYIAGSAPSGDLHLDVVLTGVDAADSRRLSAVVRAGTPLRFTQAVETSGRIASMDIRLTSATGQPVRVRLDAVRLMGQTPSLRDHLIESGVAAADASMRGGEVPAGSQTSMPMARMRAMALLVSTTPGFNR